MPRSTENADDYLDLERGKEGPPPSRASGGSVALLNASVSDFQPPELRKDDYLVAVACHASRGGK